MDKPATCPTAQTDDPEAIKMASMFSGIDDQERAAREWAAAKTDDLVRRALTGVAAEFLLYAALPLRDPGC